MRRDERDNTDPSGRVDVAVVIVNGVPPPRLDAVSILR